MIAVANSSVLISLSSINLLTLLNEKFEKIYIPHAVWSEVVEGGRGEPGADDVKNSKKIEVLNVKDTNFITALNETLDRGESEAIALAVELGMQTILIDEKQARLIARRYELKPLGTIGILIWAKRNKIIKNLKEKMDQLMIEGFRVSKDVYFNALKKVNEFIK